jgi:EF hand
MKILIPLCGVVVVLLVQGSAIAADRDARMADLEAQVNSRFVAADANNDGQLTPAEAKGKMPRVYAHFDEIDTTHKGFVTLDEVKAFGMAKLAERQQ